MKTGRRRTEEKKNGGEEMRSRETRDGGCHFFLTRTEAVLKKNNMRYLYLGF